MTSFFLSFQVTTASGFYHPPNAYAGPDPMMAPHGYTDPMQGPPMSGSMPPMEMMPGSAPHPGILLVLFIYLMLPML